jgi:hypothetical protein
MLEKAERYSKLKFPVHKIKAESPAELFQYLPGLRRFFQTLVPADSVEIDKEGNPVLDDAGKPVKALKTHWSGANPQDLTRLIKYVVFVYDSNSDLHEEYPDDYELLKNVALKDAGFRRNKDNFWQKYIVNDILELQDDTVVRIILDYLQIQKSAIWRQICFLNDELYVLYKNRMKSVQQGSVMASGMKDVREREDERLKLIRQFFQDHKDLEKMAADRLYPITPENVFRELKIPESLWKITQIRDVSETPQPLEADH